jgi:hypothetical protein
MVDETRIPRMLTLAEHTRRYLSFANATEDPGGQLCSEAVQVMTTLTTRPRVFSQSR